MEYIAGLNARRAQFEQLYTPDTGIVLLGSQEVRAFLQTVPFNPASPLEHALISGERVQEITEAIGVHAPDDPEQVASILTIAPQGEMRSGTPTFVTGYTLPQHRRKGLSLQAFRAGIVYCRDICGFPRMRVDVVSYAASQRMLKLTPEERAYLDIHDSGIYYDRSPLQSIMDTPLDES